MISLTSTATQEKWGEVIRDAQREYIEVTSHGKPTVYILSAKDFQKLQFLALEAKLQTSHLQAENGEFSTATADDIIEKGKLKSGSKV